jgi:lipoate-protein ligase A
VTLRLLDLGIVSAARSQAVYHALAEAMTDDAPDTLVLLTPETPYFCVGYHQDLEAALDTAHCRTVGLPIIRRQLGGGAVYLDRHQLFYQLIVHRSRAPLAVDALYARYLQGAVEALRQLGVAASLTRPNEIEVEGRRIAGTGAGQIGEAVVVVGNILFDFAYDAMAQAWHVPSEAFRRLAVDGLRSCLTTLSRELSSTPSVGEVKATLVRAYAASLDCPVVEGSLTDREISLIQLAETRLTSPDWVEREGTLRQHGLKISARVTVHESSQPTDRGSLRLTVRLKDGLIDDLHADPKHPTLERSLAGLTPQGDDARNAVHLHESRPHHREAWTLALQTVHGGNGHR